MPDDTSRRALGWACFWVPCSFVVLAVISLIGGSVEGTVKDIARVLTVGIGAPTIVLVLGLMIYLIRDVARNPQLPTGTTALWIVALIVVYPFSIPLYWVRHMRLTGGDRTA